jgi:hypothetical protein
VSVVSEFHSGASHSGLDRCQNPHFRHSCAQQRQDWLQNEATPSQLRAAANQEAQQARAKAAQVQADASLAADKDRDQYLGFKPLPPQIDSKAIRTASPDQMRRWFSLYGKFQLNQRLRQAS